MEISEKLKEQVFVDLGRNYKAMTDLLNARPLIDNPEPQAFYFSANYDDVSQAIPFAAKANIDDVERFDQFCSEQTRDPLISDDVKEDMWSIQRQMSDVWELSATKVAETAADRLSELPVTERSLLNLVGTVFVATGLLTQENFDAVAVIMEASIVPDPDYITQVEANSWAIENLERETTSQEVREVITRGE